MDIREVTRAGPRDKAEDETDKMLDKDPDNARHSHALLSHLKSI